MHIRPVLHTQTHEDILYMYKCPFIRNTFLCTNKQSILVWGGWDIVIFAAL